MSRKGANKAKMNMSDIVKVFLEMEIDNAPIFEARNLAELPPLTVDSLDSLKLITELETVKQEMQFLANNQRAIMEMVKPNESTMPQPTSTNTAVKSRLHVPVISTLYDM